LSASRGLPHLGVSSLSGFGDDGNGLLRFVSLRLGSNRMFIDYIIRPKSLHLLAANYVQNSPHNSN
jgi:hypothetical protein